MRRPESPADLLPAAVGDVHPVEGDRGKPPRQEQGQVEPPGLNNLNKSGWTPPVRKVYVPRDPPPEREPTDSVRIEASRLVTGRPVVTFSAGYRTPPAGLSKADALAWAERTAAEVRARRRAG